MQTFLPYPSFQQSVKCLDWKRLGKQRLEARQIINVLQKTGRGFPDARQRNVKVAWRNHPAVLMWVGYELALGAYLNTCINEWIKRGYKNTMVLYPVGDFYRLPWWMENRKFHASHRSNLLRKDPEWYGQFGWGEPADLPYYWPVSKEKRYGKDYSPRIF